MAAKLKGLFELCPKNRTFVKGEQPVEKKYSKSNATLLSIKCNIISYFFVTLE